MSCLLAHRQQLTDSCAAFVTDMEGCYDSVKDLCGNAHCKQAEFQACPIGGGGAEKAPQGRDPTSQGVVHMAKNA